MFKRNITVDINSVIGEGSYFKGNFQLAGPLRIDGRYEGENLNVDSLTVGETGRVKADIKVDTAVISGIVIGNIEASTRVMLMPTSRILGEIRTPELIIQNGVMLEGACIVAPDTKTNPKETILSLYNKHNSENDSF